MNVQIIINPAAGQDEPILSTINSVFRPAGVTWDVSITHEDGDAMHHAKQAVDNHVDIIAVYGGDGTVTEVADALVHTDIPLAILPGGTANALARELSLPFDLTAACQLIADTPHNTLTIDLGQVNKHYFLIRVGSGIEANIVERTNRAMKDRYGLFAYIWSALQDLTALRPAQFTLHFGQGYVEIEGLSCGVINAGATGVLSLSIPPMASVFDGLLDIVIIPYANLATLVQLFDFTFRADKPPTVERQDTFNAEFDNIVYHRQIKSVTIESQPQQLVQYDGEIIGRQTVTCQVVPQSLRIIAPPQ